MSGEMVTFEAVGVFAGIASVDPSSVPRGATEEAVADVGLLAAQAIARREVTVEIPMRRARDCNVFMIGLPLRSDEATFAPVCIFVALMKAVAVAKVRRVQLRWIRAPPAAAILRNEVDVRKGVQHR